MNINEVNPQQALELISQGALLIDVREMQELQQKAFRVQGVVNIPYTIFDENYTNLPQDRSLILACHLGVRSLRAAQFLVIQGWDVDQIYSLQGGIVAWQSAGFPVISAPRQFTYIQSASSCACDSAKCCEP